MVVDPTMISLVLRFQSPEVYGRWFVANYIDRFLFFFFFFFLFLFFLFFIICSLFLRYKK